MSLICNLCKNKKESSEIIKLLCKHVFCWTCIENYLKSNLKNKNKCPERTCAIIMKDCQVRKILCEEDILRYEAICLGKIQNGYKCLLPDCGVWVVRDGTNIQFECVDCTLYNCIDCKLAHKGVTCGEVQSMNGQTRNELCQREMDRANIILQSKLAQHQRASILEKEKQILISNSGIFNCQLCCSDIAKNDGITIRNCFHEICRKCLSAHILNSTLVPVPCPFAPCSSYLEDRECREILGESEKLIYETKSIRLASKYLDKVDHCRQFNCDYLCDLDKDVKSWTCKKCSSLNCVSCNVIHTDQTCEEYASTKVLSLDERKIEDEIKQKRLMRCLDCKNIIKKTSGCNWISCPNCGIELCWVTQNYRWGPKGPGDVSGGCKCGENGKMCHTTCSGCIADVGRRHRRYQSMTSQLASPYRLFSSLATRARPPPPQDPMALLQRSLTNRPITSDRIMARANRLPRNRPANNGP